MNNFTESHSDYKFRPLTLEDSPKIVELNNSISNEVSYAGLHSLSHEQFKNHLSSGLLYFGAFDGNENLVGFAYGQINNQNNPYFTADEITSNEHFFYTPPEVINIISNGNYVYSESIMVDQKDRGTGLAQTLYFHYTNYIKETIAKTIPNQNNKPVFLVTEIKMTNPRSVFFALKKTNAKVVGITKWRENEHFFLTVRDIGNSTFNNIKDICPSLSQETSSSNGLSLSPKELDIIKQINSSRAN